MCRRRAAEKTFAHPGPRLKLSHRALLHARRREKFRPEERRARRPRPRARPLPRGIAAHAFGREGARIPYKTTRDRQEASTMAEQKEGRESFPKNESTGEG